MKKAKVLLSVFALFCFAGMAAAGEEKLPKDHPMISITFPDGWTVEPNDDGDGIIALSKDETVEIDLWGVDPKEMKKDAKSALDAMGEDIGATIDEYITVSSTEKPVEAKHNGLDVYDISGKGKEKDGGKDVNFSVTLLTPDQKNIFVMLYWGDDAAEKQHAEELQGILKTLKKL